jgi:hypothetical protein
MICRMPVRTVDEGDHHERHGTGGGRDHAGAPADDGDDDGDAEGGVEPDLRIDPRDDREGDRLGDEGQRHHGAREQVVADVRQPVVAERVHVEPREECAGTTNPTHPHGCVGFVRVPAESP